MNIIKDNINKGLDNYIELLKIISSLSKLFSDSSTPYINYRVAENIFCKAFKADNLSRSDTAFDAKLINLGIGIKTFISHKGISTEKIAEFNSLSNELRQLKNHKLAERISFLRNERINFAQNTYAINECIYHCITRTIQKLIIFDSQYESINLNKIKITQDTSSSLQFKDDKNEYSFNYSKSTLYKKFYTPDNALIFDIKILDDPFEILQQIYKSKKLSFNREVGYPGKDYVVLPLYSLKLSKNGNKKVAPQSGLNQWHAGGRNRDFGEVYIPVPAKIHNNYPNFFPKRYVEFILQTPTNLKLSASICQDNSKALMTNPNNALSDWLLRDLLKLKEGDLLTYDKLKEIGIDSVIVTRVADKKFKIDFAPLDSYDEFEKNMKK